MKAILLAAGVGERLKPLTDTSPKCLTEIGGRTMLHRHLDILSTMTGIDGMLIVVGYLEEMIREAVAAWRRETGSRYPVEFETNPEYRQGSILSLFAAARWLVEEPAIVMDADVVYHPEVLGRLVRSRHVNCFLLDRGSVESGEEMMVCATDGRALHIARSSDPDTRAGWDVKGEGVGFCRLAPEASRLLVEIIGDLAARGHGGADYERALAVLMKQVHCGYEEVTDLPWTEVDFQQDVEHAERDVLPRIQAITGS